MAEPPHVWRLTEADAEAAGAVLARAFLDEPVFVAALPDPEVLARFLPTHFAADIRYGCRFGESWAVGTEPGVIAGAVYWVAVPGSTLTPQLATDLGFEEADPIWGPALARVREFVHQGVEGITGLPERWRYLSAIGVAPDRQRQGLGAALLRKIVADAAVAGLPIGLVTDRPENVPFYRRAGFELTWQGMSHAGKVPLWSFRTRVP